MLGGRRAQIADPIAGQRRLVARLGATGFKVSPVGLCGARSSGSAAGVWSVGRLALRGSDRLLDLGTPPLAIALEEIGDEAPQLLAPRLSHAALLQGRLEGLAHLGGSGETLVALAGQRLVGDGCVLPRRVPMLREHGATASGARRAHAGGGVDRGV